MLSFTVGNCIDFDLGMESGAILDSQLTASSELNASTPAKNGRLNAVWSSWCASTNDSNPYLQIDLQTLHIICAVSTQGNFQGDQWVESYTLQASTDGTIWTDYKGGGQVEVNGSFIYLFGNLSNKKTAGQHLEAFCAWEGLSRDRSLPCKDIKDN